MSKQVNIILFLILALLIPLFYSLVQYRESFVTKMLNPDNYPIGDNQPLLVNDYPVKPNANVTRDQSSTIWKEYPVYANSYKQTTNNKRYWSTPDNGLCSPAEFCGALYKPKEINPEPLPPILPPYSSNNRVNYYEANDCY